MINIDYKEIIRLRRGESMYAVVFEKPSGDIISANKIYDMKLIFKRRIVCSNEKIKETIYVWAKTIERAIMKAKISIWRTK